MANKGINVGDCIWIDVELQIEESSVTIFDWLSTGISLLVNIFATILIGWETRNHLRITAQHRGSDNRQTHTGDALKLLVESGAVFCAMQSIYVACSVILTYVTTGAIVMLVNIVFAVFAVGAVSIACTHLAAAEIKNFMQACYPIAVIILIKMKS
ncbi:hypothetical protein GYMLUDRAFT_246591 [Collybiopsis luxurians FD-317 M1]|uniref:Uncharacterized protein n=1 Tax=Collybiopsis luxurians FD-317 M1 TaxID=944289 RepID=A0A0D0BRS8_9AGAR|nr:hypothetical protein GYMLUDRAFT_246591 [Collybiopsis luxurians FD-317 M1]